MLEELDKNIKTLDDTSAGWVTRRDAVEALGLAAKKSLAALKAHANEKDVDVRAAVVRALADVGASGGGAPPSAGAPPKPVKATPPTMKELAQACAKKGKRGIKPEGDGFIVRVQLKDDRVQYVQIARHKRGDGRELIRVSTECGGADAESIAWAIRSNGQFVYCAFCVEERGGKEHLTIVSNFDPNLVTPVMVKDAVKEIAFYGDWLEQKLTGEDHF